VSSLELSVPDDFGHGGSPKRHEEREGIPVVLTTGRRRSGSDEKWLATNFDGRHPSALDGKVARCNTPCI
jgi:hypothetical protein